MKNYTVVRKPSLLIIGIECRTSNNLFAAPRDIPKHWKKFQSENIIDKIPNKISHEIIALYCDYESDHTGPYSLVLGCPVISAEEIPEGMVAKVIPESSYALFKATGDYPQSLISTWTTIWRTDLKRTYSGDFEFYGENFFKENSKQVDIFVAIQ